MTDQDDALLSEERQVEALRRVVDLRGALDAASRQVDEIAAQMREAAMDAVRAGAPRRRTQELAHVGPALFYRWLDDAGIGVRAKKGSKRRRGAQEQENP